MNLFSNETNYDNLQFNENNCDIKNDKIKLLNSNNYFGLKLIAKNIVRDGKNFDISVKKFDIYVKNFDTDSRKFDTLMAKNLTLVPNNWEINDKKYGIGNKELTLILKSQLSHLLTFKTKEVI